MADNSRPGAGGAPLIRPSPLQGDDEGIDLRRLLPAWIISGFLHVIFLGVLMLFGRDATHAETGSETAVIETIAAMRIARVMATGSP